MKTVLISAVAAAVVAVLTVYVLRIIEEPAASSGSARGPVTLSYTMELVEDGWVNGSRTTGIDHKPLAHSENSVCYLTKIEIKGVQGPEDSNICRIEIDDFTGFWEVVAEVAEGGRSEVRCNARCLVWE